MPPSYYAPRYAEEVRYRYYCPDHRAYYPEVRECPSAWLKVAAETSQLPYNGGRVPA